MYCYWLSYIVLFVISLRQRTVLTFKRKNFDGDGDGGDDNKDDDVAEDDDDVDNLHLPFRAPPVPIATIAVGRLAREAKPIFGIFKSLDLLL